MAIYDFLMLFASVRPTFLNWKSPEYNVATGVLRPSEELLRVVLTVSASKNEVVVKSYIPKKYQLVYYCYSDISTLK